MILRIFNNALADFYPFTFLHFTLGHSKFEFEQDLPSNSLYRPARKQCVLCTDPILW